MHVFLITQYFPPEIGAAASRWGDYVDILVQRGHKVTVLCGMPNYPQGKRFDGYNNLWVKREKKSSNFRIIRSAVWANDRKSTFKMLGNYLSFAFSGIINSLNVSKPDLIIISSPPLFVGIIGIVLSWLKKGKILLDVRDLWPESVIALGSIKSKRLIRLGRFLESKVYDSASGFIFPVPGFKKYFLSKYPKQCKKPMINLLNGINDDFLYSQNKNKYKEQDNEDFTVLYSGNIGLAQGLEVLIEVAHLLMDRPIKFKLIGEGVFKEKLQIMVQKRKLSKVTFYDPMPKDQLISEIQKASICIVPLKNKPLFRNAIPSKIYEFMALKKPIILGVEGEAADIINKYKCGIVIPPENRSALKKAILTYFDDKKLIKSHGENGVTSITKYFRKEVLISDFLKELHFNFP